MAKNNQQVTGLELVMQRNAFYRDAYRRVVLSVIVLFFVNCGLACVFMYQWMNPPKPQYFPTTPAGIIIKMHPLTDPTVTDDYVLQWTGNAVRDAFSQDFLHWKKQLQDVMLTKFTPNGRRYFLQALHNSNNLKTLVDQSMVSTAELTGAPEITGKGVVGGHYAWKVQLPLLVTYTNGNSADKITMAWNATVIVLREPVANYPDRIAINNFLTQPRKTALF